MESYLHNPRPAGRRKGKRNPAGKPGTRKARSWMSLVKKHGVQEAAKRWSKSQGRTKSRKGGRKMARKGKKLSAAHRAAISRGLRRAHDGRRHPLSSSHKAKISRSLRRAADGRRHPLSSSHKASISRSLRRAADGRRHSLSGAHRAAIGRGVRSAWRRGAYGGGRGRSLARRSRGLHGLSYGTRQPLLSSLGDIIPTMEQVIDAGKVAGGALAVTFAEPYVVKLIGMVYKGSLPEVVMIPLDIAIAGALGVGAGMLGQPELGVKLMEGGLVATILNAAQMVKGMISTGRMGVIVPESVSIGQDQYDFEIEGYEPERTVLSGLGQNYIREYGVPTLGQGEAAWARPTVERFRPYFSG